ncbi:hypothetical protein BGX21_005659, partial [Mortierella sp. AD011]
MRALLSKNSTANPIKTWLVGGHQATASNDRSARLQGYDGKDGEDSDDDGDGDGDGDVDEVTDEEDEGDEGDDGTDGNAISISSSADTL